MASNKKKTSQFQEMANAVLNDKFPELTEDFLGFQVIPSSIDEERMAGVIAVLLGGEVAYIPLIFNGGNISGDEVIYLSKKGIRVPSTSAWISALQRNTISVFSSLDDVSGLSPGNATVSTEDYIIKLASACRLDYSQCDTFNSIIDKEAAMTIFSDLKEDIPVDLAGFVAANPHLSEPIEKMARDLNVVNAFVDAGYDAKDLDKLYGEFGRISDKFEKQAQALPMAGEPELKVTVIKADDKAMKNLSTANKTIAVRKGYFVDDKRSKNVSSRGFHPIQSTGFYNILGKDSQDVVPAFVYVKQAKYSEGLKEAPHTGKFATKDLYVMTGGNNATRIVIEPSDGFGYESIVGSVINELDARDLDLLPAPIKNINALNIKLKKNRQVLVVDTRRMGAHTEAVCLSSDVDIISASDTESLSLVEIGKYGSSSVAVIPSDGMSALIVKSNDNRFMTNATFRVSVMANGYKDLKLKKDGGSKVRVIVSGDKDTVCCDKIELVEKLACSLNIHGEDVSRITTALNDSNSVEFLYKEAAGTRIDHPETGGDFGSVDARSIQTVKPKRKTEVVKYNPAMLRTLAQKTQETDDLKEVFDIKTLSHLFEMDNSMRLKKNYVKNLVKAMDACGSLIILFSWDKDNQVEIYGEDSYDRILTSTSSKFKSIGDLVLFINEKSDLFDKSESDLGYLTEDMG